MDPEVETQVNNLISQLNGDVQDISITSDEDLNVFISYLNTELKNEVDSKILDYLKKFINIEEGSEIPQNFYAITELEKLNNKQDKTPAEQIICECFTYILDNFYENDENDGMVDLFMGMIESGDINEDNVDAFVDGPQ